MIVTKDTTVTVIDGEFRIVMGKTLTTFYAKEKAGVEISKFTLRTADEIDKLITMLQTAKTSLV